MAAELEVNIASMLGLNNRRPDFRLRTQNGVFERAVVNADVTDGATIKRRRGYARSVAGSACHSFWVDDTDDLGYYADGANLYRVRPGLQKALLTSALHAGRPLTYARVGDEVFASDGLSNYAISATADIVRPLGAAPLARVPVVTATTGGALLPGVYQICFAFINDGREISPTTPTLYVTIPDAGSSGASVTGVTPGGTGALAITELPSTWSADVDRLLIYVSAPNGTVPLLQHQLVDPATSFTLTTLNLGGMHAMTQHRIPLPPGQILRWHSGRLYSVVSNFLWFSEVYSPAICDPVNGYVQFNEPITVFEPCDSGVYLVADGAYWLEGDITQAEAKKISPNRGVFGTGGQIRALKRCFWMSDHGFMVGDATGNAVALTDENVAVGMATSGASLFRENDGQRHLLSAVSNSQAPVTAARSYMTAEVIRKGTKL